MEPWFIATQKFSPADEENWTEFIEWSRLTQLDEVVSLDPILCPPLLPNMKEEYWPYIVDEAFLLPFFTDLPFLLHEVSTIPDKNVLCVYRNPTVLPLPGGGLLAFEFLGYDLVDVEGGASALTNCGGFPEVFSNDEISPKGLLTKHTRAVEVQKELRRRYPGQLHTDCHLWAIFRAVGV